MFSAYEDAGYAHSPPFFLR